MHLSSSPCKRNLLARKSSATSPLLLPAFDPTPEVLFLFLLDTKGAFPTPLDFVDIDDFNKRAGPPAFSGSKKAVGREDKHVVWFRAPSAPSIPKQDQAFGYEEGPLGQLVKQKPPLLIHKGEREDRVGPGNYDPSIAITKPNARGSDFSRSKWAQARR